MSPDSFLKQAHQQLSSNPYNRLSLHTQNIINKSDYVADIHCHLFDIKTINIKYLALRLFKDMIGLRSRGLDNIEDPYTSEQYNKAFDTDEDWSDFIHDLENRTTTRGLLDVIDNRSLLWKKSMREVYNYYLKHYRVNQYAQLTGKDLIVTALMMDLEMGWGIKTRKSFQEQIQELKELSQTAAVLPFFPIDPRRADNGELYQLFLNAFPSQGASFFGVKVYPGLGFLPSDYRLMPIYQICQEKNIPVLTHCGGEAVTCNNNNITAYRLDEQLVINKGTRQEVAFACNQPQEWLPVLERFPKLKLNFGHFGGDESWQKQSESDDSRRVKTILEIMAAYPNVYADFSFNIVDPSLYQAFIKTLKQSLNNIEQELVLNRVLFGSDFWVVCGSGDLQESQAIFLQQLENDTNYNYIHALMRENVDRYLF